MPEMCPDTSHMRHLSTTCREYPDTAKTHQLFTGIAIVIGIAVIAVGLNAEVFPHASQEVAPG